MAISKRSGYQSVVALLVGRNPYLFKGGTQDRATGFVKFGGRWYDPTSGRWTQQDTLDAPLDPANANRYAFAGGDPINGNDPTGGDATSCGYAIAGEVISVAAIEVGIFTGVGVVGIGLGLAGVDLASHYLVQDC